MGVQRRHLVWQVIETAGFEAARLSLDGLTLHATGRAVTRADLAGGEASTARVLKGLGFDVVIDEDAMIEQDRLLAAQADEPAPAAPTTHAPAAKKTTATKKVATKPARPKPAEREVKICPTCYTALPATGVCDFCD